MEEDKNQLVELIEKLPLFGLRMSSLLGEDQIVFHTQNKLVNY